MRARTHGTGALLLGAYVAWAGCTSDGATMPMPDGAVADAGARGDEDGGTDARRNGTDGGDLPIDASADPSDAGGGSDGGAEGHAFPIYLNFSGLRFENWRTGEQETVPAFRRPAGPERAPASAFADGWRERRAAVIEDVVAEVERIFAPFDVEVRTSRPPEEGYAELVIGGDVEDSGDPRTPCEIGGHAPLLCGAPDRGDGIRRGYVHSACKYGSTGSLAQSIAGTIAHEAGHLFGLEHADSGGIMDRRGVNEWRVGEVTDDEHGSTSCRSGSQDSHEVLMGQLGPRRPRLDTPPPPDTEAPKAEAILPEDGTSIPPTFGPCLSVHDESGIQYAFMQMYVTFPEIDEYALIHQQVLGGGEETYRFRSYEEMEMADLDDSAEVLYRIFARDEWGNLVEARRHVTLDPDATAPSCP